MALSRQRLLTLAHEDLETIRLLPNNFKELEDVVRGWLKSLPEDIFSLRVPIEYASMNASRMVTGPYIYLSDEESYQIAIMGVQGVRVEVVIDVSPHREPPLPPDWSTWRPNPGVTTQEEENMVIVQSPPSSGGRLPSQSLREKSKPKNKLPEIHDSHVAKAIPRPRFLTLAYEEMETIRMLPGTFEEVEALARAWTKPPLDTILSLRVPVEYASLHAARITAGPYIHLVNEYSYQMCIMGNHGLRVEIVGDAPVLQDEPFSLLHESLHSENAEMENVASGSNTRGDGEFETVFDAMASKYLKVNENDNQTPIATLKVESATVDGVPFVSRHPKPDDLTGLIFREDHVAKGGGGFADVYKGVLTDRKQVKTHVAIKVIRSHIYTEHSRNKILKRLRREIFVWIGLQHPNILPLLGVSMDFGPYEAMVCPWMQDGDLNHFLDRSRKTLTLSQRFDILSDVSAGLAYLHSKAIIHGDLTSANVLMENGRAYLCDFGLSSIMVEFQMTSLVTSNVAGTCRWTAPELFPVGTAIETKPVITKACDIYSFGCITLHVISGHRPYQNIQRNEQVLLEMFLGRLPSRPTEPLLNDDCWEFINNCWSRNADERPDIDAVQQQLRKSKSSYQPQFLSYLLRGTEIDND